MIPYIEWSSVQIGPITLYVWGFFVALGFLVGGAIATKRAAQLGLVSKHVADLTFYLMLAGMVGGRLGNVFFYEFSAFAQDPAMIFRVWDGGFSLFGGILLSVLVAIWFFRKRKVDVFAYADASIFGLPFGLWIGRIGCFLVHDHPGTATDFFLGVQYPDGVVRHDHGLYLSLNGLAMGLVFLLLSRKKRPIGLYLATFSLWYGIVRFFLDFYRISDVKYHGLTPAQYFSLILIATGVGIFIHLFLNARKSL